MNWYAAHIIMVVKYKAANQKRFPAWENIVLLRAASPSAALKKLRRLRWTTRAMMTALFRWGGKPARWEFAGVRKLTECALAGEKPASGDEITYSELEFASFAEAKRYGQGAALTVKHDDQIQSLPSAEKLSEVGAKRKPA